MKKLLFCLSGTLLLALATANPSTAQEINASLPMSVDVYYGPVGIALPEAVNASPVGLNPATLTSPELQLNELVETDYGFHNLKDGPKVRFGIVNYAKKLSSKDSIRISFYDTRTDRSGIPATGGAAIQQQSSSIEIAYSRKISDKLSIGLAYLPEDRTSTELDLGDGLMATGSSRSTFQGRVGILWQDGPWKIGSVYSYEKDKAKVEIPNLLSDNATFYQKVLTSGISYSPKLGTTLFANTQRYVVTGNGDRSPATIRYYGVQQFLTPQLVAQLAKVDKGEALTLGYLGKDGWQAYASYTRRAFSSAEPIYGKGNTTFLSVVKAF